MTSKRSLERRLDRLASGGTTAHFEFEVYFGDNDPDTDGMRIDEEGDHYTIWVNDDET